MWRAVVPGKEMIERSSSFSVQPCRDRKRVFHARGSRGKHELVFLNFYADWCRFSQILAPVFEEAAKNVHEQTKEKKPALLGYFAAKETEAYATFRRVASDLRDDCNFYFVARPAGENVTATVDAIHFKPPRAKFGEKHETYLSQPHLFDELKKWASEKCIPLVREITFENAEELTEEGLPFLILFHHPDDKESVEEFTKVVHEQLQNEKHAINPLIADGVKFAHPLQHLGKTVKDLPLIAIDSFRHMYRFPDFAHLKIPGKLKAFVDDLYSGKLHREFHYGPDPTVGGAETEAQYLLINIRLKLPIQVNIRQAAEMLTWSWWNGKGSTISNC
ncbi:hypothetical protein HPB49_022429 [Dermacentor silvarum]|uniref:Uncharacterized protein n=1 Tax=Dermacentor silvarum TaxID=543639 RepID=A0ACB8E3L9_DERSI|nr:hypothetical protein HPB49_022429 [Dermacentor silvarum]